LSDVILKAWHGIGSAFATGGMKAGINGRKTHTAVSIASGRRTLQKW
jgi:hypothetical protein